MLASLPAQLAGAERMEEANSWRNPVDLVGLLEAAFAELPRALEDGAAGGRPLDRAALVETILVDEPAAIVEAILAAVRAGADAVELASAVSFAAARRIARFPTSNEFGDWDTALHTFTFANAVEQGLRRSPSPALLRGVLDGAVSVHLDRFLNVPATRLPEGDPDADPAALLGELPGVLDRRQQVDEAAAIVASFVAAGGDRRELIQALGAALVRENRNFHTIQCVEAAVRQHELLGGTRRRDAAAGRGCPLPGSARHDHPLAAPDLRHRAPPAPRRDALRGRRLGDGRLRPSGWIGEALEPVAERPS